MRIQIVQDCIDSLRGKQKVYHPEKRITSFQPPLYNQQGGKYRLIYLQDRIHPTYLDGSRHIWWDRYNWGLNQHVYTHTEILRTRDEATNAEKYAWFIESKAITPKDYLLFDKHPGLASKFKYIFTWDIAILERFEHARFIPAMHYWYGGVYRETPSSGDLRADACEQKTKLVSMVSSEKTLTPLQHFRIDLARRVARLGLADTYGRFDGGLFLADKADSLTDYRYSIAIENDIQPFYFTEKILDCFASMTVPIYCGASDIGSFFNLDGIIQLQPGDTRSIETILRQCSCEDYDNRREAVKENYLRVMEYSSLSDYMWNRYLSHEPSN